MTERGPRGEPITGEVSPDAAGMRVAAARNMTALGDLKLTNLVTVGAATPRSARIWARAERPGRADLVIGAEGVDPMPAVEVAIAAGDTDGTAAWTYPDDFPAAPPLEGNRRYHVRLLQGGADIGEAQFRTPPESRATAPRKWTFGAMSCHQPFAPDGAVHDAGTAMLRAAHRALSEAEAQFVLLMGDQIYADYPPDLSLFEPSYFRRVGPPGRTSLLECDRQEVRRLYQERYRQFWALPGFQSIQSSFACYPILDDHEIIDNFGTDPDHAEAIWDNVRAGALDAYYDYQASRVLPLRPRSFDYGFTWGPAAVYVMDIRAQRRTRQGLTEAYSRPQLAALKEHLDHNAAAGLQVLVTTIPLVYVESYLVRGAALFMSRGSDLHERWSHPSCVQARDLLIRLLHDHALENPHQTILLLGGDVHTGAAYAVQFEDGPRMFQLVSSAISNEERPLMSKANELMSKAITSIDAERCPEAEIHLFPGTRSDAKNPFGGLNLGLVDVVDYGESVGINLRLVTYRDDGWPHTIFESGELSSRS